jgi:predicted small secreted protein
VFKSLIELNFNFSYRFVISLVIAASLFLSACGGGSSGSGRQILLNRIRMLLIGILGMNLFPPYPVLIHARPIIPK